MLNTINLIYLELGQLKELFSDEVQQQLGKEYELLESQNGISNVVFNQITNIIYSKNCL